MQRKSNQTWSKIFSFFHILAVWEFSSVAGRGGFQKGKLVLTDCRLAPPTPQSQPLSQRSSAEVCISSDGRQVALSRRIVGWKSGNISCVACSLDPLLTTRLPGQLPAVWKRKSESLLALNTVFSPISSLCDIAALIDGNLGSATWSEPCLTIQSRRAHISSVLREPRGALHKNWFCSGRINQSVTHCHSHFWKLTEVHSPGSADDRRFKSVGKCSKRWRWTRPAWSRQGWGTDDENNTERSLAISCPSIHRKGDFCKLIPQVTPPSI